MPESPLTNAELARALFERVRWPHGPVCPHCAVVNRATRVPARRDALFCHVCRRQFTVLIGTMFEGSHLELHKWLHAVDVLCAPDGTGVTIEELGRTIGVTYKTAWSVSKRIRRAASEQPLRGRLTKLHPKRPLTLAPLSTEEALAELLQAQPKKRGIDSDKLAKLIERLNAREA